ncbi:MAG: hypothetical protein JWQ09_3434 [Segetibacter sp.]|nr:hypothetical protein [Segetibacter sp.]
MSLFACPKSNQKRPRKTITARFPTGIPVRLLCYCGEVHLFPDYYWLQLDVSKQTAPTYVEAIVALLFNQGVVKGTGCFVPFLIFLWLLSFHQGKESDKMTIKPSCYKLKVVPDLCYQSEDVPGSNRDHLFQDINIQKIGLHRRYKSATQQCIIAAIPPGP